MKDGVRAEERVDVSRQDVYEDYVKYLQRCTDVRPCREDGLLEKAARYLQREPEPGATFTVFPFYRALCEGCEALNADCRKLVSALEKAAELLETLCVSLYLQPWKKEIKTIKTFTGPFVYCLLPVFSSSTIQSVLGSIGYLLHTDSEYRLSEDANPDRAMLVGFELLLATVQCRHFLELLDKDQLGPQEWLEVLQRRMEPSKQEEPTEKKMTVVQKEEEKKKGKADGTEVAPYLDTRLPVKPQAKPRRCHLISVDHSIMEMQMNYPDLAFRGRPLLSDKAHRANTRSGSKSVHTAGTNSYSDDSKAADPPRRGSVKHTKVAALAGSRSDSSRAAEVFGDDGRSSGCNDRNGGRSTAPADAMSSSCSNTEGVDDELTPPQAVSLHLTLRAGATAEQRPQPTVEPPAWTQQQTAAELQTKKPTSPGPPSLSSTDEEQELRELAERMGQLHVQETKAENKRGEESTIKERRKKERKVSTQGEAEEQNLRRPVMETGPALSCAASRCTRSSQCDPTVMKEPKPVCHPPPQTEGGGAVQQEGERAEKGRAEEEQLAQSFVIVECHKK
ncbi:uncharacterized protein LOC104935915 [Larimichthys crocea]|uniref:uncharacterized protein LOC104935915 n=1 Tax=Larimichthys crocea TaxID=215358 RepID=UPI0009020153|nr:uncharacterized protein LOC104935915 [Larimichthys crocea]